MGTAATPSRDRLTDATKWALLAALTLAFLALLAAAAEGAIRVRQFVKYGTLGVVDDHYTLDERIGLRVPIANLRRGRVETDSRGFRGPEITMPKPPGTLRLAFLGASTTWCGEVSIEHAWPHLVAADLRRRRGARVDYVNGGVPGYVAASSLKNLIHRVAPLDPDVIVIYEATNDLSRELRGMAAARGLVDGPAEPTGWLARHSLLVNLAEKNLRILHAQGRAQAGSPGLDVDASRLGEPFRRDLTALVRESQRHAKTVVLATFATQLRAGQAPARQLEAAASALYYTPFMTPENLLASYQRYNEVIREVARATGAVLIEGEDEIPGDLEHFTDSVHFTEKGSHAMAERILRGLPREVLGAS